MAATNHIISCTGKAQFLISDIDTLEWIKKVIVNKIKIVKLADFKPLNFIIQLSPDKFDLNYSFFSIARSVNKVFKESLEFPATF